MQFDKFGLLSRFRAIVVGGFHEYKLLLLKIHFYRVLKSVQSFLFFEGYHIGFWKFLVQLEK